MAFNAYASVLHVHNGIQRQLARPRSSRTHHAQDAHAPRVRQLSCAWDPLAQRLRLRGGAATVERRAGVARCQGRAKHTKRRAQRAAHVIEEKSRPKRERHVDTVGTCLTNTHPLSLDVESRCQKVTEGYSRLQSLQRVTVGHMRVQGGCCLPPKHSRACPQASSLVTTPLRHSLLLLFRERINIHSAARAT